MQPFAVLVALSVLATSALATPTGNFTGPVPEYGNNCSGSFVCAPSLGADCARAVASVNPSATYTDQAQFSVGHCLVIYATNGEGAQPVSGSVIIDTARSILSTCSNVCGSFGTNNAGCPSCHVTLNYRS
ncbi:hypothetical protein PYCCODRAFT_1438387 [Trametes coccinea BRFM310]|uniref:Uncharacterized protein n=1 Tax=Trametes coccinea (strain BRFM310) TaxID=1353009 RepID=A0A1Y2IE34_TRAC3|nr:hypothetical protein PYCCODRAFT_1438387 [Trametes coccinea BRFM310]